MAAQGQRDAAKEQKQWEDAKYLELCEQYGFDFLEQHHITHDENDQTPFFCKLCGAKIQCVAVLENHLCSKAHTKKMSWAEPPPAGDFVPHIYEAVGRMSSEDRVRLLRMLLVAAPDEFDRLHR